MIHAFVLIGAIVLAAAPAFAAGIDCKKAKTRVEIAICADPDLMAKDKEMAVVYADVRRRLSPNGQKILRESQQRWIRHVNAMCRHESRAEDRRGCISDQHSSRLSALESGAVRIGPYVFSRIDFYAVAPLRDDNGRPYERIGSYPRIDAPATKETEKWNQLKGANSAPSKSFCDAEDSGKHKNYFTIKAVGKSSFALTEGSYSFCGGSHGLDSFRISYYHVSRLFSPITLDELFKMDDAFFDFFADRSIKAIKEQDPSLIKEPEKVAAYVKDRENWDKIESIWEVDTEGFTFRFGMYVLGGYADGYPEVKVPWDALRPYLQPNAPIPE